MTSQPQVICTPFLPNRKCLTAYYRPRNVDLPPGEPKFIVFTFPALTQLQTAEIQWPFDRTFLLLARMGNYVNANDAVGFRVQLTHTHAGKTRPLYQKPMLNTMVLGTGQLPLLARDPYPFVQGDSLLVEVKNLSTPQSQGGLAATSRIEVVLYGSELEDS